MWTGFKPNDFLVFEETDMHLRIGYIRDHLHPRLRMLGGQIRKSFLESRNIDLRCQLRSGRWYRTPLWTNVSLVAPEEERRSDTKRPRLSVYIDDERVIAGFCATLWNPEWKKVFEGDPELAGMVDSTAGPHQLQIGILHRTGTGQGEILVFPNSGAAFSEATRRGQDFIFVGRVYSWPDEQQLLYSPSFAAAAQEAMFSAWPIYEYAFYMVSLPFRE